MNFYALPNQCSVAQGKRWLAASTRASSIDQFTIGGFGDYVARVRSPVERETRVACRAGPGCQRTERNTGPALSRADVGLASAGDDPETGTAGRTEARRSAGHRAVGIAGPRHTGVTGEHKAVSAKRADPSNCIALSNSAIGRAQNSLADPSVQGVPRCACLTSAGTAACHTVG